MQHATIKISGMSCNHCVMAVRKALGRMAGVKVNDVTVGTASVEFDPGATSLEAIRKVIADEGYEPQV